MSLESEVLDILAKRDASADEISKEINVDMDKVVDVLRRLRSAGLLIEV